MKVQRRKLNHFGFVKLYSNIWHIHSYFTPVILTFSLFQTLIVASVKYVANFMSKIFLYVTWIYVLFIRIFTMDIKFHVSKIIDNGNKIEDWALLVDQLKQKKCDRDLLLQVLTIALNNSTEKTSKRYKKLLIGLASLQR